MLSFDDLLSRHSFSFFLCSVSRPPTTVHCPLLCSAPRLSVCPRHTRSSLPYHVTTQLAHPLILQSGRHSSTCSSPVCPVAPSPNPTRLSSVSSSGWRLLSRCSDDCPACRLQFGPISANYSSGTDNSATISLKPEAVSRPFPCQVAATLICRSAQPPISKVILRRNDAIFMRSSFITSVNVVYVL
jgi:hypothetical protein